jgi:hypothetical protein
MFHDSKYGPKVIATARAVLVSPPAAGEEENEAKPRLFYVGKALRAANIHLAYYLNPCG